MAKRLGRHSLPGGLVVLIHLEMGRTSSDMGLLNKVPTPLWMFKNILPCTRDEECLEIRITLSLSTNAKMNFMM